MFKRNALSLAVAISVISDIQQISYQDILWIDAAGDYMCVHTRSETHVMRTRLKKPAE